MTLSASSTKSCDPSLVAHIYLPIGLKSLNVDSFSGGGTKIRQKLDKCVAFNAMRSFHKLGFHLSTSAESLGCRQANLGAHGVGQKLELDSSSTDPGVYWKRGWVRTRGVVCPEYTSLRVRGDQGVHERQRLGGNIPGGHLVQGDSVAVEATRTLGSEILNDVAGCGEHLIVSKSW